MMRDQDNVYSFFKEELCKLLRRDLGVSEVGVLDKICDLVVVEPPRASVLCDISTNAVMLADNHLTHISSKFKFNIFNT